MAAIRSRIPLDLLEELEARYPVRRPRPGQSLEEIFEYSGQVSVVEFLRRSYEEQQSSALSAPLDLFTSSNNTQ